MEVNFFCNYGGKVKFGGMIFMLKCYEDNVFVKKVFIELGNKWVSYIIG